MTRQDPDQDTEFDSVILRRGFTKIKGSSYEGKSGTRVKIERQKQMHNFRQGYKDAGPAVPMFQGPEEDARYVYEVLKRWFDDGE